ncbi:Rv3235 family protein [Actinomycetaceae bacterium L2_0104]
MNALPAIHQPLVPPARESAAKSVGAPARLHVKRPPRFTLVPIPEDDERYLQMELPGADFARTSPQRPWDRLAFTSQQEKIALWADDDYRPRDPLPEGMRLPTAALGQIVVHAIEILLGHRPPSHLRNWLSPQVFESLVRRAGLAIRINGRAPRGRSPRVLRTQICQPRERAIEAAVVVHDGRKKRAAALRAEFIRGKWRIVALEIG